MFLEFNDARECLHRVYEERGYESARGFITFLDKLQVIDLARHKSLNEFLTALEINKPSRAKRRQDRKKILNYYEKVGDIGKMIEEYKKMDDKKTFLTKEMYDGLFGEK